MKAATLAYLDEGTSLKNAPSTLTVPKLAPMSLDKAWSFGYLAGYMDALNYARDVIRGASKMERIRK
jgi:hypothetical protein